MRFQKSLRLHRQPFHKESLYIIIKTCSLCEHLRIPRPAKTFITLWTIGRDFRKIRFHTPYAVVEKLIDFCVPACEKARLPHIGIHRNRGKFSCIEGDVRLDQCIAEAECGKARVIDVQSLFANVFDLLWNTALLVPCARREVALGKVPVFVQRFSVPQNNTVSIVRRQTEFAVADRFCPKSMTVSPFGVRMSFPEKRSCSVTATLSDTVRQS